MSQDLVEVLKNTFVPSWIFDLFGIAPAKPRQSETSNLDQFCQRIYMQQVATGSDQPQMARNFDYVRWKQHGQHRMHHNPDEYVRMCQGLTPYVGAVSSTAWTGMDERRWAGLTTVAPEIQGLQPKSAIGSRSNFGSRDMMP